MTPVGVIGAVAGLLLLIAGILVSALGSSSSVTFLIGLVAVGVGAVALTSTFFYEVGRSEDRDRTRHPSG